MQKAFYQSYRAASAIGKYLIVKHSGTDRGAALATAATDKLAGVSDLGAAAAGDLVDVATGGQLAQVICGGVIAAGDPLTADATSRAAVAAKSAGNRVYVIGFADQAGVAGDIIWYRPAPYTIEG